MSKFFPPGLTILAIIVSLSMVLALSFLTIGQGAGKIDLSPAILATAAIGATLFAPISLGAIWVRSTALASYTPMLWALGITSLLFVAYAYIMYTRYTISTVWEHRPQFNYQL